MDMEKIKKYVLSIGLNDKDTKKQEVEDRQALDIVLKCLFKQGIEGGKWDIKNGFYRHDDGTLVFEKSVVVEMLFVEFIQVSNAISDIGILLNQESIILEEVDTKSQLVYIDHTKSKAS